MSVNKLNLPKGKTTGKPGKPGAKRVEGSGDSESSDADLDRKLALQLQIDAQVKHFEPMIVLVDFEKCFSDIFVNSTCPRRLKWTPRSKLAWRRRGEA